MGEELKAYLERYYAASEVFARNSRNAFVNLLEELGIELTRPQYFMLKMIQDNEPCSISSLADKMGVKPSAVTVMLDRLEQADYVVRRHDEQDRRIVLVQLTPKGLDSLRKVDEARMGKLGQVLNRLEPDELQQFVQTFEKLARIHFQP
jgi:DNA-binding MarR family transcriptional regulator